MKIGILTQFYRRNYGGILQSYAMYYVLLSMGHDVEIIDFRYNSKTNKSFASYLEIIRCKLNPKKNRINKGSILTRELPQEHLEAFDNFKKKYLKYSPMLNNDTIGESISKYDAIVVGSDQVWNNLTDKNLFYFFDFGKPYNGKKISYAPCSTVEKIPFGVKRKLGKLLHQMDSISVRDLTTQKMVETVSGITPPIVVDPTVLYDYTEFQSPAIVKEDYVFAYILGSEIENGHSVVLNAIFKQYGKMKVVAAIIPDTSLEVEKFADEIRYNASPDEWVNLVANARFVYTDSFHGCVFSMKFHKQFLAYYKDVARASRLINLKKTYSIANIKGPDDGIELTTINYEMVDAIVQNQKSDSKQFLFDSLHK